VKLQITGTGAVCDIAIECNVTVFPVERKKLRIRHKLLFENRLGKPVILMVSPTLFDRPEKQTIKENAKINVKNSIFLKQYMQHAHLLYSVRCCSVVSDV
jgi:hypothetical protein